MRFPWRRSSKTAAPEYGDCAVPAPLVAQPQVTYPPYGPDTTFFPHAEHDLRDAAYLISRGVRPMALLGSCSSDEAVMGTVYTILINAAGTPLAEPFVLPSGAYPGRASYGYAARAWVTDLLEFAESDAVPLRRREEILGLLCGYSPDAIARHQERRHLVRWAPAFGGEVPDDAEAHVDAASAPEGGAPTPGEIFDAAMRASPCHAADECVLNESCPQFGGCRSAERDG